MKGNLKLEKGGWTPALRKTSIEIMDKIILRPVSILISDPRNGNINTFQGIREKLSKKKYSFLANWRDDVLKVFTTARSTGDQNIIDICAELEQYFMKKYSVLEKFSEFKFRDVLAKLINYEIPEEIPEELPEVAHEPVVEGTTPEQNNEAIPESEPIIEPTPELPAQEQAN
ncbi:hypothetical protein TRFO_28915 [Tritrichomonas foetus]|uniref:Bromo domain-containing protein n=1 Tax=Tritrichomonas foetus TaxID=1144522 RepID=A0A1J4K1N3_9EUKA|nr:hypothetical protein TRFO_28915 [Tritrichomonas foetus]|eukprot:OHT03654.1 hypothetical protein TRFO_28915 [Tritrichomonas foetus]